MKRIFIILFTIICVTANAQIVLTLEGQTYTSTNVSSYGGPSISLTTPTIFTFRNNSITAVCADGYFLQCGTDINGAYDGNFDGAVIEGNKFDWNGTQTPPPTPNTHGILMGYNKNYHTRHNYLDQVPLSVVVEGTGITYTEGGFYYNVLKKGWKNGLTSMGVNNLHIYNNTFIKNEMGDIYGMIKIEYMEQTTPDYMTHDHKIKNNIFYSSTDKTNFISIDSSAMVGFECDYNLYWVEGTANHEPTFYNTKTFETYTWAQWKALGYDTHSVVVNPNFRDTISYIPTVRLNYGTNLGSEYDNGLSSSAEWIVGTYPDTTQQDATWQVGAYIIKTYDADYYVAPNGNDLNPGTISSPWLTWQKAFDTAQPGDTVYYRGGIYPLTATDGTGIIYDPSDGHGNDGERNNRIYHLAYPGEKPILDCSNLATTPNYASYGLKISNLDYVTFSGLTVRNLNQLDCTEFACDIMVGVQLTTSNNIIIDQFTIHDIAGIGFRSSSNDTVLIINSDAYNCCDTLHLSMPGQYGTGFNTSGTNENGYVTYKGCRAWQCSDQSFSSPGFGTVVFDGNWAFNNGYLTGNGNGFKIGYLVSNNKATKIVKNNLAFYCGNYLAADGITTNDDETRFGFTSYIYNNTTYKCSRYGIVTYQASTPSIRYIANNIAYDNNGRFEYLLLGENTTNLTNSWNAGVTITDDDFISVDSTGVTGARQSDGSLPDLDFLKLKSTSDLIDIGTNIGLDYSGSLPDIGAFEYDGDIDSTLTDILIFTLPTQTGAATINTTNHTVSIEVAYTADVSDLTPTITLSYGATVIPASVVARDFTNPVPYTVTALDGVTTQEWTVTVTQAEEPAAPAGSSRIVKYRGLILKHLH